MASDLPSILAPKEFQDFKQSQVEFEAADKAYRTAQLVWQQAHDAMTKAQQLWMRAELDVIQDSDTRRLLEESLESLEEDL